MKVGIVGGTGYTGVELLRLLATHPEAELVSITSRSEAGVAVSDVFSNLRGRVDLVFVELKSVSCVAATWFFSQRRMEQR